MSEQSKVLKRVKETFNIFEDGRLHNPAPQQYLLAALKSVLSSSVTKERIKLNEAIGYYGHRIRQLTGKIRPTETEVVSVDGKDIIVNVIPAVRTVAIDVDDKGNVTHEQEFLDNEMGRTALSLYEQKMGGFSWAMSGRDGKGKPSIASEFSGFDYVLQPNFLPENRKGLLLASINDNHRAPLLASLSEAGIEQDKAEELISLIEHDEVNEENMQDLIVAHLISENENALEAKANMQKEHAEALSLIEQEANDKEQSNKKLFASMEQEAKTRSDNLLSALDNSPFLISQAQKDALVNMSSDEDIKIAGELFASMKNTDLSQLPNDGQLETVTNSSAKKAPSYASFDSQDSKTFC